MFGAILFNILCFFQWYRAHFCICNGCDVIWGQNSAKSRKSQKLGVFGELYLPKLHGMHKFGHAISSIELPWACVVSIARKKWSVWVESVTQIGYPKNFDPTPNATPLTQCCNLWHFYSGGHSQDCQQTCMWRNLSITYTVMLHNIYCHAI